MVIFRGQKDLKIYLERELQTLFILALLDFRRFKSITDPPGSKKRKGNFHLSRTTAGDKPMTKCQVIVISERSIWCDCGKDKSDARD